MNLITRGAGKPLLLVHGLGGSWRSWNPVLERLAAEREVIAVDLPGFGATPPLPGEVTIASLADALTDFVRARGLDGVDMVGSSMGARLVLELARRGGVAGGVVALDPGGFWRGWERHAFYASVWASIRLVRLLEPALPFATRHAFTRTLLFAQFSARPWRLPATLCLDELRSFVASPSFDELLHALAYGDVQQGAPRGSIGAPLVIGWGRRDRVCFPRQATRAIGMFPDARLHWFERSGHFPQWDEPDACAQVVLDALAGRTGVRLDRAAVPPRPIRVGQHAFDPSDALR